MRERLTDRDNKFALELGGSTRTRRIAFARTLSRVFLLDACRHSQRQRAREIASPNDHSKPVSLCVIQHRFASHSVHSRAFWERHWTRREERVFLDAIVVFLSVASSSSSQNGSYH